MNKYTANILTVIFITTLLFSGCSKDIDTNDFTHTSETSLSTDTETAADLNSGFTERTVIFPSGNDEKTDYNKAVLDIDKFTVSFLLPDRWHTEEKSNDDISKSYASVFSPYYILDENENCVGLVGYNIIPQELSGEELVPNAIYNQIALGNDYCFDIREKYDVVSSSETGETALTEVYYSDVITEGNGEKYNKGILAYDSLLGAYIAFDIDSTAVTYGEFTNIAESIKLYR